MALVVEDGTGLTNSNSYAAIATADAYFVDLNVTAWAAADTASKTAALLVGTRYVDGRYRAQFKGFRQIRAQRLEWPRLAVFDEFGWPFPTLPQEVIDATCESALRALTGELAPDLTRGGLVKEEQIGPIKTVYSDAAPALPEYPVITRILSRVLTATGGAKVVRG